MIDVMNRMVGLVGGNEHLVAIRPQDLRDFLIRRMDSGDRVDDEHHDIRLANGSQHLLSNALADVVSVGGDRPPASIDEPERATVPVRFSEMPVPRDPGPVIDDGGTPTHNPVEERRFAHVRAADQGHGLLSHHAGTSASTKSCDARMSRCGRSARIEANDRSSMNSPRSFRDSAGIRNRSMEA